MKNITIQPIAFLLLFVSVFLSSCELAGDIFEGGMWTGIIIVVLILGLLFYFFGRGNRS